MQINPFFSFSNDISLGYIQAPQMSPISSNEIHFSDNSSPQLDGKCECLYHNKKYIEYQDHFSCLLEDNKEKIVEESNYFLRSNELPVSFDLLNESIAEDKEISKQQMVYDESIGNQLFVYHHLNNNNYYLFHPIGGFNEYLGCNELVPNNTVNSKDYKSFSAEIYCDTTILSINHFTDITKGIIVNTRCHLFHFVIINDDNSRNNHNSNKININLLHKFEIIGSISCFSISPIFQSEGIYLNNYIIYKYNGNDLPKPVINLHTVIHSIEESERVIITYNNVINTYLISVDKTLYLYNENTNEIKEMYKCLDIINGIYNSIINPFHLVILTADKIHLFDKRNMKCEMNVIKYYYQLPLTKTYSYITIDNEEIYMLYSLLLPNIFVFKYSNHSLSHLVQYQLFLNNDCDIRGVSVFSLIDPKYLIVQFHNGDIYKYNFTLSEDDIVNNKIHYIPIKHFQEYTFKDIKSFEICNFNNYIQKYSKSNVNSYDDYLDYIIDFLEIPRSFVEICYELMNKYSITRIVIQKLYELLKKQKQLKLYILPYNYDQNTTYHKLCKCIPPYCCGSINCCSMPFLIWSKKRDNNVTEEDLANW